MDRSDVPSVCTSNFYYGFGDDQYWSKEKALAEITKDLENKMRTWKNEKRVIIQAMVIGTQTHAKEALIANGFVVAHEAFNYKYPDSSKTLTLLYYDMNNYKEKPKPVAPPQASPFGSPAGRLEGNRWVPRGISAMEAPTAFPAGDVVRGSYQDFPKDGVWYLNDGSQQRPVGMEAEARVDLILRSPQGELMVARHDLRTPYQRQGGYIASQFNWTHRQGSNAILAFRVIGH